MFKGKRLHPVSIFFLSFSALKELLVPFFAAFILGRGAAPMGTPFNLYFIIGVFLLLFIYGYLKWLTFTYEVNEKELEIKQGILVKKHRFIQKERVYSIDITSSVFQRLFHLVTVNIETAGGGHEPEVRLTAIRKQEAYKIKRKLLFKQSTEPSVLNDLEKSVAPVDTLWTLTQKDLIITALTSSGIGIVFMAILALITQLENWLSKGLIVYTFGYLFESSVVVIIFIFIIILIIAWLISIIATLLKYGGFKIMKKGDEIEITRGLIEKRHLTLSLTRITAIRIVESVLRQPFGLATIYVESAGGGSKDEQLSTVLFPLVRKRHLQKQLRKIAPNFSFHHTIEPLPKRARLRYVFRQLVPASIISSLVTYFLPYGFVLAFCLILGSILLGILQYKDGGIGRNKAFLWISSRSFSRTLVIIPKQRIQALEVSQSFVQKFRTLFTIQTSILTSITGKSFRSIDVSNEQKEEVLDWFTYEK